MADAVFSESPKSDFVVMAAAVADFTPAEKHKEKNKKIKKV